MQHGNGEICSGLFSILLDAEILTDLLKAKQNMRDPVYASYFCTMNLVQWDKAIYT